MIKYGEVTSISEDEYDLPDRQEIVQVELESLRNTISIGEIEIYSLPEGLTEIVDHINLLTQQNPFPFRDEQQKILPLWLEVIYSSWNSKNHKSALYISYI